jgi:hypothetical protein
MAETHRATAKWTLRPPAPPPRRPVMTATTTRHLKYWLPLFETYLGDMIFNIMRTSGEKSVEIVHELRLTTLYISQGIIGGASVRLNGGDSSRGGAQFLCCFAACVPRMDDQLVALRSFG